jgi:cellulose synthase/poly-beta-1,6-N-acetylglucosamine synthase-like glycosyltransferase
MDPLPTPALAVFLISTAVVLYAYVGYPVVIWILARLLGRSDNPTPAPDSELPTISVLIAAYNEETIIQQRILNSLALDYPPDKVEIVIATDGCTDRTADVVRRYAGQNVRLFEYSLRRGKSTVLNDSVPRL